MSCYVSPIMSVPRSTGWPFLTHAYLVCDDADELHDIATRAGLEPKWKQVKKGFRPHFDVTQSKHLTLRGLGAILVTKRELVLFAAYKTQIPVPIREAVESEHGYIPARFKGRLGRSGASGRNADPAGAAG